MSHITASSSNELQKLICRDLLRRGIETAPRGMATRELLGISFELVNPRRRITTLDERKWSPALAVAELAWNLRGDEDVTALAFYTPRWRDFADADGNIRGSCYGRHIFNHGLSGRSQWSNARRLLLSDPASRRAVLNFRVEEDVSGATNDLSCTNTIQFLIRENKLHAFVSMRSNDAIWGVPYDLFLFTCLQELMATELGVELGTYHHYAASMHLYERHYELAHKIASAATTGSDEMPAMESGEMVHAMAAEEVALRMTGRRVTERLGNFEETCLRYLLKHKNMAHAA